MITVILSAAKDLRRSTRGKVLRVAQDDGFRFPGERSARISNCTFAVPAAGRPPALKGECKTFIISRLVLRRRGWGLPAAFLVEFQMKNAPGKLFVAGLGLGLFTSLSAAVSQPAPESRGGAADPSTTSPAAKSNDPIARIREEG